jgi:hypothetical protein
MNSEKEDKFECLRLATEFCKGGIGNPIETAKLFYEWICEEQKSNKITYERVADGRS